MSSTYALGLDFGTESARALLVDVVKGQVRASAVHPYSHGVVERGLPTGQNLPPGWALQAPQDWLEALETTVRAVMKKSGASPEAVVGLGLDCTACTVLPTTAEGTPLCALGAFRDHPHAWPKLWKHHAAQPQADHINRLAADRAEPWLARYGGKLSSEWLLPKALQVLEEDPTVYRAATRFVEGADWLVWQLTGTLVRNACAAGYKACWHKREGVPAEGFLAELGPGSEFGLFYREKFAGPIVPPAQRVGRLTPEWAERLQLSPRVAVAAPLVDAHAAVLGGGVGEPGSLFMIMGTSTCHLLLAERERRVEGIAGVVEDGIVPGLFGYEAGQAAVGDLFAWFVQRAAPGADGEEAQRRGVSLHEVLSERAAALSPGQSGLLALDWWNGNRSTLVDAGLSGLVVGYTLATRPEEVYRTLIEGTAFGTRVILEAFSAADLAVNSIVVGGGLTKNPFLMQLYADILGRPLAVAGAEQVSALGAAMLGAVAAGSAQGGYDSLAQAVAALAPPPACTFHPRPHPAYEVLFAEYRRLYDLFGRGADPVMKTLRRLRKVQQPG